jgi:hypothetical protein
VRRHLDVDDAHPQRLDTELRLCHEAEQVVDLGVGRGQRRLLGRAQGGELRSGWGLVHRARL